jgi:hypothetical protein
MQKVAMDHGERLRLFELVKARRGVRHIRCPVLVQRRASDVGGAWAGQKLDYGCDLRWRPDSATRHCGDHNGRVIRLLETLLHPDDFVRDWTTRELHTRVVARHHLGHDEYRLSQLRYDLSKLRAKRQVERIGRSPCYRLTPLGLKLGVLLVKLRMRLLGPLVTLIRQPNTNAIPRRSNSVDATYREVDTALDHLSAALGLHHAAYTRSSLHSQQNG